MLIALVCYVLYSGFVLYAIYEVGNLANKLEIPYADIQLTVYALGYILNLFLIINHLLMIIFKKSVFQSIIDELLRLDTLWNKHSTTYSKSVTQVGTAILIIFYYFLPVLYRVNDPWLYNYITMLCLSEIFFFYITMQFCAILDIVRAHLKDLRDEMYNDELYLVKTIGKHQNLLRFCPVINKAYSWQILIMCFKFFVFSLMVAYLIVMDSESYSTNGIRLLVILGEFSLLFPIAKMCSDIEDEVSSLILNLFISNVHFRMYCFLL